MNGGGGMVAIVPSPGAATLNKTRSARLPTLHKVTKLAPPPTFSLLERELPEASSEPRKNTILSLSCPFGDRSKHRGIPLRAQAIQTSTLFIPAGRPNRVGNDQEQPQIRPTHRHCIPQSRDTPPKRDTGIASEKDWGINLENGERSESGVNEDGSTWYRESGQDIGDNGYCCHWTVMGGCSADGLSEWKEAWWDKSDWTGYKELGAEKSGKNAQGDSWWETWQEIFRQDDWSNLARIERSAQKQAKSGNGTAGWYEKWWEKYNAKGSTEKGAHKYGRLNDQSWWEKWGEQYDGQGAVLKWTDKWAENDKGSRWGDKWEEKFFLGMGTRQGETWHIAPIGERWSRTWGEEHFGNGKVHKYGTSTSGESWDEIADESTIYESEPHYGWADAIGNSSQLLGIEPQERPPGVYPEIDFTSAPPIPPIPPTPPIPPSSSPSPPFSPPTTLSMPSSSSLMSIPPSLLSSSLPSSLDPSSPSSPPPPPSSSSPPLTPLDSQPETSPSPPLPPSSEPPPPSELPPPQSPPNAEPE